MARLEIIVAVIFSTKRKMRHSDAGKNSIEGGNDFRERGVGVVVVMMVVVEEEGVKLFEIGQEGRWKRW